MRCDCEGATEKLPQLRSVCWCQALVSHLQHQRHRLLGGKYAMKLLGAKVFNVFQCIFLSTALWANSRFLLFLSLLECLEVVLLTNLRGGSKLKLEARETKANNLEQLALILGSGRDG